MSGYFRVTTRPATEAEQEAEMRAAREEDLPQMEAVLSHPQGCLSGRACFTGGMLGCPAMVFVTLLVIVGGLWRDRDAMLFFLGVVVFSAALGVLIGNSEERAERRHFRQRVAEIRSGVRKSREMQVVAARIAGALSLWEYKDDGPAWLLLDLGEQRLVLFSVDQSLHGLAPQHREFRLVWGEKGSPEVWHVLGYEPLDETPVRARGLMGYEVWPEAPKDFRKALRAVAVPWPQYIPKAEFPGTLDTWIEDVLRAYQLPPRSISHAEPDPDADRGLSRPE